MSTRLNLQKTASSLLAIFITCGSLLLFVSLALATPAKPADTIVVNPGDSIQAAINAANPGDTIVINAGTYTGNLSMNKAVSLTGVSSATVIIRPASSGSILTIDGSSIGSSVIISGVTISGATSGGGLYLWGDVTVILSNCQFINNLGGGIASETDVIPAAANHVLLFNTDFLSNSTYPSVGAAGLRISGDAFVIGGQFENNVGGGLRANSATVFGTQFISNSAQMGAGILAGDVAVTSSRFERNMASGEGGAIRAYRSLMLSDTAFVNNTGVNYGGAVYVEQIVGVASVIGGQFVNNRVIDGDLYGLGGGMYSFYDVSVTATDFISNSALRGGGLYARGAAAIENSRFERNASTSTRFSGGGGMVAVGPLNVTNTQFVNNSAVFDGGGLYFSGGGGARIVNSLFAHNTTNSDGAALFLYSTGGRVDLLHTTIADHTLNPKQAIFAQTGLVGMTDTIIANYAIGIERWTGATIYEDYNLFYGNTKNFSGTINSGIHHPTGNPQFVNPAAGDYHIQPISEAFNAGVDVGVQNDIDGQPRPFAAFPDIGADEYWPAPVGDLRVTTAITNNSFLTATLGWTAPLGAITYTVRYSTAVINEGNWSSAINVTMPFTASVAGSLVSSNAVIPYSNGTAYFALKSQDAGGMWSGLSNNAFWPARHVFLPLVRK